MPVIDQIAGELFKKDPAQAAEFLTDYCLNNANSVVDAWWKLGDDLLVKYNKVFLYDTETREFNRIQYPDWWLKKIIEYDKLKPQEE
jgi:dipeptidase